ncbi:unnamed protein product [Arabis nemorensis]|uniref:RING-type E3 ubiquitin transferase n=1 Tax=Arabis nemorensis TaxID=586526 RepID=A0A565APJ1_9BRAS|nr:unnamed protein product [Arabis nemorensis]
MNPLVVVSGRVASAAPFKCKDNGSFESAQVDLERKLVDGFMNGSLNFLARLNQTPWYLEDGTGRVKVVGFEDAVGFYEALKEYVDISESEVVEVLKKLVSPNYSIEEASKVFDAEGSKVLHGSALNIGTSLTFVGEAVRDKAGNLMIQEPKEHPFMVFSGEGSFDKMVDKIKSDSEYGQTHHVSACYLEGFIFSTPRFSIGTITVAVAVMYGVDFIRRWKKKKSGNK